MGQKVNPRSFRMALNKDWDSVWCLRSNYIEALHDDITIRNYIKKKFKHAMIDKVVIKRQSENISVIINAARVGIVIGKGGVDVDKAKQYIASIAGSNKNIEINVSEIKRPEINAQLIAFNISQQLEKRISFRKAIKRSIANALRSGVKGIKISCSGRLGGAEIARCEWYKEGNIPLHTLRANIEYAVAEARTIYGVIGTKVWVYNGGRNVSAS